MATRQRENAGSLIRRVLDGRSALAARRRLARMRGAAVPSILAALTGDHGRAHPDHRERSTEMLVKALVDIAKVDPKALAAATVHGSPALNIVIWAIGHSSSAHARSVIANHLDHEDTGIQAVARYHQGRRKRRTRRKTVRKVAKKAKPTAKASKAVRSKARASTRGTKKKRAKKKTKK